MDTWLAVVIFLETTITLFILWGIKNEHKFIAFEDNVARKIKRWWRRTRRWRKKYNPIRMIKIFIVALSWEIIEKESRK